MGIQVNCRSALSLIRSGSILPMIRGYGICLILRAVRSLLGLEPYFFLSVFYVISGTIVMLIGLRLIRGLRWISLVDPTL